MFDTLYLRLRDRGPAELARLAWLNAGEALRALTPANRAARAKERAFDRRWGTDTSTGISGRELGFDASQLESCHRYDPSTEAMLAGPLDQLGLDPAGYTFIDYGAGKGRMLMLALTRGFEDVIGVELSEHLCAIARDNLVRFAAANPALPAARIGAVDATRFTPAGAAILAYFYNPFGAAIMAEVRDRLAAAADAAQGHVIAIYANPEHGDVFRAGGWAELPAPVDVSTFRYDAAATR